MKTFIHLAQTPEGVTLTVRAPEDGEADIAYPDLLNHLKELGLPSLDYGAVKLAYKRERGNPTVIHHGALEPFRVELSPDEMAAHVILDGWKDESPETMKARIFKALEERGVQYGLNRDVVEEALARGASFEKVCVAEGRPASMGPDARVNHPVVPPSLDVSEGQGVEQMRVWSEPLVVVVEPKAVVAEKLCDESLGQEGMTVTGRPLASSPGADVALKGLGTELSKDGTSLAAAQAGQVVVHPRGADIEHVEEIEGNVEAETGILRVEGSVVVRGSVGDGVVIRATGDVEIWGQVGQATIFAGRNVVLRGLVKGVGQATIRAGGNIAAVSVEEAEIAAKYSIFVLKDLLGCRVGARRRIMMGPEGTLAGGTVIVGELLQVAVLGSESGSPTVVKVATPELLTKWQELLRDELAEEMKQVTDAEAKIQSGIDALSRRRERRGGTLEPHNEQILQQMQRDLSKQASVREELDERMKKLPGREEFVRAGRIAGLSQLHKGVILHVGTLNFVPRDEDECQRLVAGPDGLTMEWIESCMATL